jgi:glutamate carboxypeptidase
MRFGIFCTLVVSLVTTSGLALAQPQLDEKEMRLASAVKARKDIALAFLQKTVAINSGTLNTEGVRAVGKLYRTAFEELGFAVRWVEMPPEMKRAGHLVASINPQKGPKEKRLLLLGHMDTVFEPDSPVTPWRADADGKRVWGQGVSDMKGGNSVMLEAFWALKAAGVLDSMSIHVMLTGDEERAGAPIDVARAELIALAKDSGNVLSFEGMARQVDGVENVAIARRAAGGWALEVTGRQGHSSGVFGPVSGYGAGYELARIVNAFRERLIEPGLTFSVGTMLAGTEVTFDNDQSRGTVYGKNNIIPPAAMARGDLRYLSNEQREKAREGMRAIVAQSLHGTSASIRFSETYPPMPPTPGNARLARLYSEVSVAAGLGPVAAADPSSRGAGDIQFAAPYADGLDGLGAAGGGAHTPGEFLYVDSIERNALRAAILIHRLTR